MDTPFQLPLKTQDIHGSHAGTPLELRKDGWFGYECPAHDQCIGATWCSKSESGDGDRMCRLEGDCNANPAKTGTLGIMMQ